MAIPYVLVDKNEFDKYSEIRQDDDEDLTLPKNKTLEAETGTNSLHGKKSGNVISNRDTQELSESDDNSASDSEYDSESSIGETITDYYDNFKILRNFNEEELTLIRPILNKIYKKKVDILDIDKNSGEIIVQGEKIKGSNIVNLLKHTNTRVIGLKGVWDFYEALARLNVNASYIKNPTAKGIIQAVKIDRADSCNNPKKSVETVSENFVEVEGKGEDKRKEKAFSKRKSNLETDNETSVSKDKPKKAKNDTEPTFVENLFSEWLSA